MERMKTRRINPIDKANHYHRNERDQPGFCKRWITEYIGFGVYTDKSFRQGDFLLEYRGESISEEEGDTRSKEYEKNGTRIYVYYYEVNTLCIDATYHQDTLGRFVNDAIGEKQNCKMKRVYINGNHFLALFATKDIPNNQELRYDYGKTYLPWRECDLTKTKMTIAEGTTDKSGDDDFKLCTTGTDGILDLTQTNTNSIEKVSSVDSNVTIPTHIPDFLETKTRTSSTTNTTDNMIDDDLEECSIPTPSPVVSPWESTKNNSSMDTVDLNSDPFKDWPWNANTEISPETSPLPSLFPSPFKLSLSPLSKQKTIEAAAQYIDSLEAKNISKPSNEENKPEATQYADISGNELKEVIIISTDDSESDDGSIFEVSKGELNRSSSTSDSDCSIKFYKSKPEDKIKQEKTSLKKPVSPRRKNSTPSKRKKNNISKEEENDSYDDGEISFTKRGKHYSPKKSNSPVKDSPRSKHSTPKKKKKNISEELLEIHIWDL